jgi:hypothetical protein
MEIEEYGPTNQQQIGQPSMHANCQPVHQLAKQSNNQPNYSPTHQPTNQPTNQPTGKITNN